MSSFIFYLVAFACAVGILVTVHEYGHYRVARWCGVKVLCFSVGFGRHIWSGRFGPDKTKWAIGIIPLGGYVKMLDEREGEVDPGELHRSFNRQKVWKRMLIVAAGSTANLILAVFIYWGVFCNGIEELRPILGEPVTASAAADAGIRNGDHVVKVNGNPVQTWQDMHLALLRHVSNRDSVELEIVTSDGITLRRHLSIEPIKTRAWEGKALDILGITLYHPEIPPMISRVLPNKPAARAGLSSGDKILSIDGHPITSSREVIEIVARSLNTPLEFEIERNGRRNFIEAIPRAEEVKGQIIGRIGVEIKDGRAQLRDELMVTVRYGVFPGLSKALHETWDKVVLHFRIIGKMITGEVSWRNIGGPVTIADYAGQSARMGVVYYLNFLALISISLAVLNLLPIPILDGGHLLYYTVEVIIGRPLSERSMEIGQQVGLALLLMLMACAFYNDFNRLIFG